MEPKKGGQKAAYFTAKASSGSIHVDFPSANTVPDRNYYTDVDASAGSIGGTYLTGVSSRFHAHAGSMTFSLVVNSPTTRSDIFTQADAGSTQLKIEAPFSYAPLQALNGVHRSAAGSVHVRYPRSWEGKIVARTVAGRVKVDGQGVHIDKSSDSMTGGFIEASKGTGNGMIEASGNAGGLHVGIGN